MASQKKTLHVNRRGETEQFVPFAKTLGQSGVQSGCSKKTPLKVNFQMALGQTAGCPRVNRAKKFMCSPRNTGNINFPLWLTGGLSQGCPDF